MTDPRIAEARALRVDPGMSIAQLRKHFGVGSGLLTTWLRGIEPPSWTRRPNAKDDVRSRALTLRVAGWTVNDIATELAVSKSTVYGWVKHLPLDPDTERARAKERHAQKMLAARWAGHRAARDQRRSEVHAAMADAVGPLSHRDVLILGAAIYWCEGAKSKPWRRSERLTFVNSDPASLSLHLRFLDGCGRGPETLTYRLSIHENADAEAAMDWWAQRLELYWRVEGVMAALTRLR